MKRSWYSPSLARRVFITLVIAFFLAGSALVAYSYQQYRSGLEGDNPWLLRIGRLFNERLQNLADEKEAVLLVRHSEALFNDLIQTADHSAGNLVWLLGDRNGAILYQSHGIDFRSLVGYEDRVTELTMTGKNYWLYSGKTDRWIFRLAAPQPVDITLLGWMTLDLVPYLLLSFPFVLLPLWIAIHRGLSPLRKLAERLAARDPDDLSPLGVDMRYTELVKVTVAFDGLLASLRSKVERERVFVQDAAHELRTPMAVISAQAHVLARATEPEDRQQAEAALDGAIARASHLTRQLLDLASLDHLGKQSDCQAVDLAQLLQEQLAQIAPSAFARQIEISLEAPDSLMLLANRLALQSIIQNLLDNALKYGKEGGRIVVTLGKDVSGVFITVADDGPGISPEERPRIFERFYRGSGHDAAGTGLGLAICSKAAQTLGGSIHVSTGLNGMGTSFMVRLPKSAVLSP